MPITARSAKRIVRPSRREIDTAVAGIDWARIDGLSDARIARAVAPDPDAGPIVSVRAVKSLLRSGKARILHAVDVAALRGRLGLSQDEFAHAFGFSAGTVRGWEQGRRQPDGPARTLLTVIASDPDAVIKALWGARGASKPGRRRTTAKAA